MSIYKGTISIFKRKPKYKTGLESDDELQRQYARNRIALWIHILVFASWLIIVGYSVVNYYNEMSAFGTPDYSNWIPQFALTIGWGMILIYHLLRYDKGNVQAITALVTMNNQLNIATTSFDKEVRKRLSDDVELIHGNLNEGDLSEEEIAYYEQMQRNQRE